MDSKTSTPYCFCLGVPDSTHLLELRGVVTFMDSSGVCTSWQTVRTVGVNQIRKLNRVSHLFFEKKVMEP